jgi:hypothetical protein
VISQKPPVAEEEAPFQNSKNSGRNKNMVIGSKAGPNLKMTVLARTNSNLLDCVCVCEREREREREMGEAYFTLLSVSKTVYRRMIG